MRTPRRRQGYSPDLCQAYAQAVEALSKALPFPIKHAGLGHWGVFAPPVRAALTSAHPLPGTSPTDLCVVVPVSLWQTFRRLSAYVEALCLHEWALFTEGVRQERHVGRGEVYAYLTARPDNRRPLSWELNQVDVLLHETGGMVCPWTQKRLTSSAAYDLDHLLPLRVYPVNELWNLLPVDREFNQRVKRDRIPSWDKLVMGEPWIGRAYEGYGKSAGLGRALREDAALRFGAIGDGDDFALALAGHTIQFIEAVASSRYGARWG